MLELFSRSRFVMVLAHLKLMQQRNREVGSLIVGLLGSVLCAVCFWLLQRKAIESALSLVECSVQEGKCITIMTCLMYIPVLFRFAFVLLVF